MSRKIFDNDLVTIHKNKVTLMLNKPAYTEMCILELSNALPTNSIMITLKINSRQLFTEPDNLMYEIKTEDVYKDFKETRKL